MNAYKSSLIFVLLTFIFGTFAYADVQSDCAAENEGAYPETTSVTWQKVCGTCVAATLKMTDGIPVDCDGQPAFDYRRVIESDWESIQYWDDANQQIACFPALQSRTSTVNANSLVCHLMCTGCGQDVDMGNFEYKYSNTVETTYRTHFGSPNNSKTKSISKETTTVDKSPVCDDYVFGGKVKSTFENVEQGTGEQVTDEETFPESSSSSSSSSSQCSSESSSSSSSDENSSESSSSESSSSSDSSESSDSSSSESSSSSSSWTWWLW